MDRLFAVSWSAFWQKAGAFVGRELERERCDFTRVSSSTMNLAVSGAW